MGKSKKPKIAVAEYLKTSVDFVVGYSIGELSTLIALSGCLMCEKAPHDA